MLYYINLPRYSLCGIVTRVNHEKGDFGGFVESYRQCGYIYGILEFFEISIIMSNNSGDCVIHFINI